MVKVLLDTDIGTDVDDAVALAYLLSHPDCELLGVTTVTGEASKRASLADVLCKQAGKEIPIYPGSEQPLVGVQRQTVAQQAAALPRWPHTSRFPEGEALEFLRSTIRGYPGQVVLLTIGPLTNIGRLFSADPEIPSLLKGLVMMGGVFGTTVPEKNRTEWNLCADPQASAIVYRSPVRLHRSVGLDVTQQVVLPAQAVRQQFTSPLLQPVLDFAEIWFAQFYPFITFHDPLAAATIFEPDLCSYQPGTVTIQPSGPILFQPGGSDAPHQVALRVEPERYFEHFFGIV